MRTTWMQVTYRDAVLEDATSLTELMLLAGGDILQFVLDELAPGVSARKLYMHMVTSLESECSYRHCVVASIRAGQSEVVIGMANAFPTALLKWADNKRAIKLYKRMGFAQISVAPVPWHPELPHIGGSISMRKYF